MAKESGDWRSWARVRVCGTGYPNGRMHGATTDPRDPHSSHTYRCTSQYSSRMLEPLVPGHTVELPWGWSGVGQGSGTTREWDTKMRSSAWQSHMDLVTAHQPANTQRRRSLRLVEQLALRCSLLQWPDRDVSQRRRESVESKKERMKNTQECRACQWIECRLRRVRRNKNSSNEWCRQGTTSGRVPR